MSGFRLVDLAKPFLSILPDVEKPTVSEVIQFDDKIVYTLIVCFIYLFAQLPLAGTVGPAKADPIFFLRNVFGAESRTLVEFGLFPIVSASIIMQLLAGLKVIKVNFKLRSDRVLFQTFTKILALFQYFVLANIFIFSGYYGEELPIFTVLLLNFQLVGAGAFMTLLTEVIDKGFGFESGVMAILTINAACSFVTDILGFQSVDGGESQGAIVNLITSFRTADSYVSWIVSAFTRDYLPNLTFGLIAAAVIIAVMFLQNFRVELPIRSTKARGMSNVFPIRLLYTGGLSVLFSYTLLFYIHIVAYTLISFVPAVEIVLGGYYLNNILAVPKFPLSLFTPPTSLFSALLGPWNVIVFGLFVAVSGAFFAYHWQRISGSSARDMAAQFKEQGITLAGHREQSISRELDRVIPVAAVAGSAALSAVVIAGEFLGLKGKAAGLVVGVASGFALLEKIGMEYQMSGGKSAIAGAFGGF